MLKSKRKKRVIDMKGKFTSKNGRRKRSVDGLPKRGWVTPEALVLQVTEKRRLFFEKATIQSLDVTECLLELGVSSKLGPVGGWCSPSKPIERFEDKISFRHHQSIRERKYPDFLDLVRNGRTLQALNELDRLAVSNKFRHRYRMSPWWLRALIKER